MKHRILQPLLALTLVMLAPLLQAGTPVDKEVEDKDRTLYAYCAQCQDNIFIHYKESFVKNAESYPVYLVWVHGKPFHGLLVRIDKNFVSRGERVVHLEFDPELSNHYG